jgi:hypothetical protein
MKAHVSALLVPVALLSLLAAPALADSDKAVTNLVRPQPTLLDLPPDADARGTLRIDTQENTGRDRLKVVVKKVNDGQTYALFMEDPEDLGGPLVQVATLAESGTTQKLELDTDKGDALPFAVTEAADLSGLAVEVRVGSDVYLRGTVPAFGGDTKNKVAKEKLDVDPDSPDGNAKGELRVSTKESNGDDRIRVLVKQLDFESNVYSLWVEDGVTPGEFVQIGLLQQTGKFKGEFERRTKDGAPLSPESDPDNGDFEGIDSAADFVGRELQVRDQNGEVYLSETVPPLT